jgi:hypothetical protein
MSESRIANPTHAPLRPEPLPLRAGSSPKFPATAKQRGETHRGARVSMGDRADPARTAESLVRQFANLHTGPSVFHFVVRLREAAIPSLEAFVRGPSQAIHHPRCLAVDALAAIATPGAVRALTRALRDCAARELDPVLLEAEGVLVNHIAEHLSRFPAAAVSDALLAALRHRPYPYCAAALGLAADVRAIPLLVDCLFDDPARPAAAAALRKFGNVAFPWLAAAALDRKAFGDAESPTRVLGRAAAAKLVGQCGEQDDDDIDVLCALRQALADPQSRVQLEGALALARRQKPDALVAGILVSALADPAWVRVKTTAAALARLPNAGRLIVDIISARANSDPDRRRQLRAVGLAGTLHLPGAVPRLRALATAADPKLRLAAISALGLIPTADADSVARFLTDKEPVIRRRALQVLRRQNALTADSATPFLGDEDPDVRRLADASVRDDFDTAWPALQRAAFRFGAPLQGWSPRLRLWWHAWRLLAEKSPSSRRGRR